jgi:BirA family biotin operon repressor/biotin-[acetyl-CoA-carboxylase] ligase
MQEVHAFTVARVNECDSTSDMLKRRVAEGIAEHGYVLRAAYQTSGHGQGENTWESAAGSNLLLSINLNTSHIRADEQANCNFAMSLALYDLVNSYLPGQARIKWPNDIYVGDRKVAGLLIENTVQGPNLKNTITGIGLNVTQEVFTNPRAVSLATLLAYPPDLEVCFERLLTCVQLRYEELVLMLKVKLRNEYQELLYRKGVESRFRLAGVEHTGVIEGVDDIGRLRVRIDGVTGHYNRQQISMILQ